MKKLGVAKKILVMRTTKDMKHFNMTLSLGEYIRKVLEMLKMKDAKPISTPLSIHFKLVKNLCPNT
jgi:hypothetical protein